MNLESFDKDRAIHNELQRADLRCAVENALDERRIVGAAAFGDVTIELRARLAGDDDAGVGR